MPIASAAVSAAARHTAAAEELAAMGDWEQAYRHLRDAMALLHGRSPADELDRLRQAHAEAHEQSRRDSLTATYNRRYLDERLLALLDDPAGHSAGGLSVALIDVDHFKQVNDTWGHPFGDRVLARIGAMLGVGLPHGGFCARYGGEEFALVLPGLDLTAAVAVAEDARARVADHPWAELDPALRLTVSAGVAQCPEPVADTQGLLATADVLLYAAKHAGRNAVAYRDPTGALALAGAAAARRAVRPPGRTALPARDRNAFRP